MPVIPTLFPPDTDEYKQATAPHNSSGSQQPASVAAPKTAEDVAAVVREAARQGLRVLPQATGHGAGGDVGADTIILDTSGLNELTIDVGARIASAGAGLTWGQVNGEAEQQDLLGLAGSAPSVALCGYTFGGGLGWLSRPYGMASSALRRVHYVTGTGEIRTAAEDAVDPIDRDALWAFRGGGGVGIATRLEFDLVAVPDLTAGYLLWPADALDDVVTAWADGLTRIGDSVATSIAVLVLPAAPNFPAPLRGKPAVHLAIACSAHSEEAQPLLDAVRAAAEPMADTWGPADVQKLSGIHLDPPNAVPAIGDARWLNENAPGLVADALRLASEPDSPLQMIEVRSVGNSAPARGGAETTVPGPFIVHAVGGMPKPDLRPAIELAFQRIRAAIAAADTGRSAGSWAEGATSVPDALPADIRERVRAIADVVDPQQVIARSRYLT